VVQRAKRPEHPDAGAIATLAELVALRPQARGLDLGAAGRVQSLLAGPYDSPFRGRGMDFDEVRAYQPGDDVRTIDWRVTARTGSAHTKVFHEERERPLWLWVDAGPSMHFGTRRAFKSVAAARAAAILAWAGREMGERIGALVVSPERVAEFPPKLREPHLFRLLGAVAEATRARGDAPAQGPAESLARLRRLARAGSRVFLIGDFYELDEAGREHLGQLSRRCEVSCVLVYDPLEAQAPPPGRYRVTDGRRVAAISPPGGRRRDAWGRPFAARRDALRELCRRHRIRLLPLRTDEEPAAALAAHAPRARRKAG
jgi:uncharacterized protein (DUF58 family)